MSTNDRRDSIEARTKCAQSHKPAWWTESLETSWGKVKAEATRDWRDLVNDERQLGHTMDEAALALGHGAREVYSTLEVWGGSLEDMLKADWKETGHDAECAWARVREAVKHGWERAAGPAKPAAPDAHG